MAYENEVIKALESVEDKLTKNQIDNAEIRDRILQLEQRQRGFDAESLSAGFKSAGDMVAKAFSENSDSLFKNRNLALEVKAVLGSQVGNVGSMAPSARPSPVKTSLVSAIPTRGIGGITTLNYSRLTDPGAGAAVQNGEGASKQQAQPEFARIAQNAITVAGWCELSEQSLKTQGELARVIDTHLTGNVMTAIDNVLVDGTAVAAWPFAGFEALATAYVSATYTLLHDAIVEAAAHLRWAGYEPKVVVLNPMTFLDIALKKDTTGQYLTGAYMSDMPAKLHGMRVCFSSGVALGKALVMDTDYVEVLISDTLNVTFGYVNDQYIKNLVSVRAEASIIPVARDLHAIRLVSPKP